MQSAVYLNRSPYYEPNWRGYSFQPERARRLLEEAGCVRGAADGVYSCGGERLSIRVSSTVIPGSIRVRALELVQPGLEQVGIELVPQFMPSRSLFDQLLSSGQFEMAIHGWTNPSPSPFFGKVIYGCGGELNWTGYCQRLVTKDLDQAERILDAKQRARVMNRADAQMAKDVPVIPLYAAPVWAVTPEGAARIRAIDVPACGPREGGRMVARRLALTTAIAVVLLTCLGRGRRGRTTPKRGGTLVFGLPSSEPACLNVLDGRCHNGNSLAGHRVGGARVLL